MSKHIQTQIETGKARIVEAPIAPRTDQPAIDRSFNLPKELYIGTVGGYLGFLALVGAAFMNPVLIILMVIFVGFIIAGFGVPALFTQLKGNDSKPMGWGEFANKGIMTATGRLSAGEASVQVLILPALLVCWGIAVVTIAAFVG